MMGARRIYRLAEEETRSPLPAQDVGGSTRVVVKMSGGWFILHVQVLKKHGENLLD